MAIRDHETGELVDPASDTHERSPRAEVAYRIAVNEQFPVAPGQWITKLENFAKYVPRQTIAQFLARYEIFKLIENVQGSIVECGVCRGNGIMSWANFSTICEPYNFQRRIVGFDTFSGFPDIEEADRPSRAQSVSPHLRVGGFACPDAFEDLQDWVHLYNQNRYLNHIPKIELVRGDFEQTGARFLEENPHFIVSCLYLDFDLYKPTKLALDAFVRRIPRGGVIVFDELNEPKWPGETIAALDADLVRTLRIRRFPFHPSISYAVIGD